MQFARNSRLGVQQKMMKKEEEGGRARGFRERNVHRGKKKKKETDEITCTTRRLFISSEIGMYIQNMVMEYARTHDTFASVE